MTTEVITLEQYRALKKVLSKYGNERLEEDGYTFDSKAEAARYRELLLLSAGGAIEDLAVHPTYELQPAFRDARGCRHRAIVYMGDFSYIEVIDPQSVFGRSVVEDVKGGKGTQTALFKLKAKLFRFRYPDIDLRILDV